MFTKSRKLKQPYLFVNGHSVIELGKGYKTVARDNWIFLHDHSEVSEMSNILDCTLDRSSERAYNLAKVAFRYGDHVPKAAVKQPCYAVRDELYELMPLLALYVLGWPTLRS